MAKRILNRKELRSDYEAAERRKDEDEEGDEAVDESEEDDEEEAHADDEEGGANEDEEAEEKPKKKKPAPKTTKAKPRTRAVKVVRMRVVWGVFNNSNQCVATYEYPKRAEADAHAAKLTADKKNTHFVQPIKEPIETKKEE